MTPLARAASICTAAALLGLASSAAAQPRSADDFRWSGVLPTGQWIEVKGVYGDIAAEPSSGREVEVVAVRTPGVRGSVEDVRIETIRHEDGVTICALYTAPSGRRINNCEPGGDMNVNNNGETDATVDFVVRVPAGVHFLGATVNGSVDARSLPGDAVVSSVNGSVRVSAARVLRATTVNGTVDAVTAAADAGRDLAFTSVNGNVTLEVPADFRASVDASTLNGRIRSDFPLSLTLGRYVGRSAEGEIGGGGRRLHLKSVNGSIEIRRR